MKERPIKKRSKPFTASFWLLRREYYGGEGLLEKKKEEEEGDTIKRKIGGLRLTGMKMMMMVGRRKIMKEKSRDKRREEVHY
ncbi:hypothetical protein PRIPAC_88328 [Pristionchus pacificus]|uniref:Uncharacterized protein n=1 Tax=Pristionchus pacificus TaxID=54126 RepID=A0A2A6B8S0_PRIPA|nr:hypothetical protein PRIPAC_88328 [Pristionchus pacificus]|eukprot:PDM62276.1 hypothetical protein PRIPAC_51718 [Pristionchus pacificus]